MVLLFAVKRVVGSENLRMATLSHAQSTLWFMIPLIGSALSGMFFIIDLGNYVTSATLLAIGFFVTSALYATSIILVTFIKYYSPNDSSQVKVKLALIIIFSIISALCIGMAGYTILVSTIYWAKNEGITAQDTIELACKFDYSNSCTGCPAQCPEWSTADVEQILRSCYKVALQLGIVLLLLAILSLLTSVRMFRFYRDHKVEYV